MSIEDYIREAEGFSPVSREEPSVEFLNFYKRHGDKLGTILLEVKKDDKPTGEFKIRAGMMPPKSAVINPRIKEFCRLPCRTTNGVAPSCFGILNNFKACPPHSPPISETTTLLNQAVSFLIVQLDGSHGHNKDREVHPFIGQASEKLREHGYGIIKTYDCGPCYVCPNGCGDGPDCRQPAKRLFALESCGFWINRLCRESAKFPILVNPPREIRWIRDWGLPTQDTQAARFVTGILLDD